MPVWAWILLLVLPTLMVGLMLFTWLDAYFTRTSLPEGTTLNHNRTPGLRTLFVYLPGILADGQTSCSPVIDTWECYGDVLTVSYSGDQLNKRAFVMRTANKIVSLETRHTYDRIVYLASSMGGMLAPEVSAKVARRSSVKQMLILIDSPSGRSTLGMGGNIAAPLLVLFPFGQWSNALFGRWVMDMMRVPPKDDEIQSGLDKEAIKRAAIQGLSGWSLSLYRDQLAYMALRHLKRDEFRLYGRSVVYLRCTLNNVTVKQPQASEQYRRLTVLPARVIDVASPHCGYLQQPEIWNEAFVHAFRVLGLRRIQLEV